MSTDNIAVAVNVIQTVTSNSTNTITYNNIINEPVISAAQGPQGIQGISSATSISNLTDVSYVNVVDGALLVYNSAQQVWVPTTTLAKQTLECGQY